jgi:hypothetical protein
VLRYVVNRIVLIACAALLLMQDFPLAADAAVEVWVVLSEPALATVPRDANEQRNALRLRLAQQQDDVIAQLAALGAVETARVQYARNAIAVRIPSDAIDRARKIQGVIAIHPVTHRNRIDE